MTSVVNRENTAEAAEAKTAKTAINPTGRFRGTKVPLPLTVNLEESYLRAYLSCYLEGYLELNLALIRT